jgi:hypothetical protein
MTGELCCGGDIPPPLKVQHICYPQNVITNARKLRCEELVLVSKFLWLVCYWLVVGLVGWLWSDGGLDFWFGGCMLLVSLLVSGFLCWLVSWLVDLLVSLVCWLVGWFFCLFGRLVGWLFGYLVGW